MSDEVKVVHGIPVLDGSCTKVTESSSYACPRCSNHGVSIEYNGSEHRMETGIRTISLQCYCHKCCYWTNLNFATLIDGADSKTWVYTNPSKWKKYSVGK